MIHLLALALLQGAAKPEPTAPFTFALYGDCRDGDEVHGKICEQLVKSDAKFVVQTGDLVHSGNDKDQWATFRKTTTPLREKIPYYPAKGNHDRGDAGLFESEFKLERSFYTVRQGPVELFILDGNRLDEPQIAWLKEQLAASKATHKIAVFHHPCFTLVSKRVKAAEWFHDKLHALLVEAHVCAVFNGHDHLFYTTARDGLRYVVTGGGGAPLYEFDEKLAKEGDLFGAFNHYLLVDVQEKSMSAQVYEPDGKKKEKFAFPLCEHR